jgi:hypothetical protein
VPALLSGEVHYTLSFGNIIGSAMAGLPFKILAVLTDKPLHSIVARPEIKTIGDMRGKRQSRRTKPMGLYLYLEWFSEALGGLSR